MNNLPRIFQKELGFSIFLIFHQFVLSILLPVFRAVSIKKKKSKKKEMISNLSRISSAIFHLPSRNEILFSLRRIFRRLRGGNSIFSPLSLTFRSLLKLFPPLLIFSSPLPSSLVLYPSLSRLESLYSSEKLLAYMHPERIETE